MKGYTTNSGYMGYIPNKGYILFCTENEYKEYYRDNLMSFILETN